MQTLFMITTIIFGLLSIFSLAAWLSVCSVLKETKKRTEKILKTLDECLKVPNLNRTPSMVIYSPDNVKVIFAIQEYREFVPSKTKEIKNA